MQQNKLRFLENKKGERGWRLEAEGEMTMSWLVVLVSLVLLVKNGKFKWQIQMTSERVRNTTTSTKYTDTDTRMNAKCQSLKLGIPGESGGTGVPKDPTGEHIREGLSVL